MPNCFSLTNKKTGQVAHLHDVDAEICKHFNIPCDPNYWAHDWYGVIGLLLACGKSFERIEQIVEDTPELVTIAKLLDENYTSDAWYETK
jgi:hypothetical protein